MNQYTLDGVPLRDPQLRWFSDRSTGIRIVPARRNASQSYPLTDGDEFIPGAPYDPGSVAISLQVRGDSYLTFRKNVEFITALFTQRHKLIELRDHYDPDNPSLDRVAAVTLASSVQPRMITRHDALVSAVFNVPKTFWRSADVVVGETLAVTNDERQSELMNLTDGNAPISDMLLRIRGGSFSSLYIEDVVTGSRLNVNTALAATETMIIDPVSWKAVIVNGVDADTWSLNQGRNVSGLVTPNHGYGSMFTTEPSFDPVWESFKYRVRVKGTNVTGAPTVAYRARRSYL